MNRLLALFIILCITSCASNETADSKDVSQTEIYQTYRINCMDGETTVTASFRFGGENGTTLRITDPGSITCDGKPMREGKFLFGGAFYTNDNVGVSGKHTFRFTDMEGKVYENGYEFEPVEFKKAPRSASGSEDLILPVTRPIKASESITFTAECDTIKSNESIIGTSSRDLVYYDDIAQALVVKAAFFEGFPNATATIWMGKDELRQPLEQPTNLPGEMHFSFKAKSIKVKWAGKK